MNLHKQTLRVNVQTEKGGNPLNKSPKSNGQDCRSELSEVLNR